MSQATIIIPTLNEASNISHCLTQLLPLKEKGFEIILVDGGSTDKTLQLAQELCDKIIISPPGRAQQMNTGALHAHGETLFFLHADTQLPKDFVALLPHIQKNSLYWGRFDVDFSSNQKVFKIIANMMNLRSRITGICTGDQVFFMSQSLYRISGGYPEIALMEDIAMSKKLKAFCAPLCLRQKVRTSSRRWEQHGVIKTIIKMWYLRLAYFIGIDPKKLARQYE
ncbi:Glycosyl transferase, family 2 [uncultured Candidatus Thioglobus sp.]|nr:Glycosyl transferase, family 2 [uncultured Candidatus Thioglobus sp.]